MHSLLLMKDFWGILCLLTCVTDDKVTRFTLFLTSKFNLQWCYIYLNISEFIFLLSLVHIFVCFFVSSCLCMCICERETDRERIQCETCICESILAHLPKWSTILILMHVSAQSCMSLSQDKLLSSKGVYFCL